MSHAEASALRVIQAGIPNVVKQCFSDVLRKRPTRHLSDQPVGEGSLLSGETLQEQAVQDDKSRATIQPDPQIGQFLFPLL